LPGPSGGSRPDLFLGIPSPKEKGSWGILLVPFVCAATLGGAEYWPTMLLPTVVLLVCMIAAFLLRAAWEARTPQASWPQGWKEWITDLGRNRPVVLLAVVATYTGVLSLLWRPQLAWVGCLTAALYALQLWIAARHKDSGSRDKRSLAAEIIGVGLLTASAPAAWIAARGRLNAQGVAVWLANLLFFFGGVLYVKYRVRGILAHRSFDHWTERLVFVWPVLGYHLILVAFLIALIAMNNLPAAVLLAFVPALFRTFALLFQLGRSFPIRRLGWTEVGHSLVFAVVLIAAFWSKL